MNRKDAEDLRERLLGQRFYNEEIDEAFTVVGVQTNPQMVLIQYDDGSDWDEMATPDLLPDEIAERVDVSSGGIDASKHVPLPPGPSLDQACSEEVHDWYPQPSQLGFNDADSFRSYEDTYHRAIRCRKCGLSGSVVGAFLGHSLPILCDRCSEDLLPHMDDHSWEPTPEWPDAILCTSCTETVVEAYKKTLRNAMSVEQNSELMRIPHQLQGHRELVNNSG